MVSRTFKCQYPTNNEMAAIFAPSLPTANFFSAKIYIRLFFDINTNYTFGAFLSQTTYASKHITNAIKFFLHSKAFTQKRANIAKKLSIVADRVL